MLHSDDAAGGEALPVARAVDVVHDRAADIARPQKIRLERMHEAIGRHRLLRRRQRLAQHLAAKHLAPAQILALATKQVLFDPLQREKPHQLLQHSAHTLS